MAAPLSHERVMIAEALGEPSIPRLLGEELIAAARDVIAARAIVRNHPTERKLLSDRLMNRAIDRLEELVGKP